MGRSTVHYGHQYSIHTHWQVAPAYPLIKTYQRVWLPQRTDLKDCSKIEK